MALLPKTKDITSYILFVLIKRKSILAAVGLGSFLCVLIITSFITPSWKATTKIMVEKGSVSDVDIFGANSKSGGERRVTPNDVLKMKTLLGSETIARQIVKEFRLDDRLKEKRLAPTGLKGRIQNLIASILTNEEAWFDTASMKFREDQEKITIENDSNIINIDILADTRELAVNIANRMVEILKERSSNFSRESARESYAVLNKELARAKENYNISKENVANYKINNSIIILEKEKLFKMARIDAMESLLDTTAQNIEETTSRLAQVTQEMGKLEKKIILSSVIAKNPLVIELESKLENIQVEIASELILKTRTHPKISMLRAKTNRIKSTLINTVENITKDQTESINPLYQDLLSRSINLKIDDISLNAREKAINKALVNLNRDIKSIPERESELAAYKDTLSSNKLIYQALSKRLGELSVIKESSNSDYGIRVLDIAYFSMSSGMARPNWTFGTVAAIAVGIIFGFGAVFILEFFNDSIKSVMKVNSLMDTPCLGVLPDLTRLQSIPEAVLIEDDI